ncbi:MAG: hypothetical protein H7X95_13980 [Deltaproteobacteria bacterium]|nr:hypothetical protein [Deltaproteobacteria bacterium]
MDHDCFEWIEMYLGIPPAPTGPLGAMLRSFSEAAMGATHQGTGFIFEFLENGLYASHRIRCLAHGINHFPYPQPEMFSHAWANDYLEMLGLVVVASDLIVAGGLPCEAVEGEVLLVWPSAPLVNLCDGMTPVAGACEYIMDTADPYLDTLDPKSDSGYWFQDRMPVLMQRRGRLLDRKQYDPPGELPAPKQQYLESKSSLDRMNRLYQRFCTAKTLQQARHPSTAAPNPLEREKTEFVNTVRLALTTHGRDCKAKLLYAHCQPMAYPTFLRIRRLLLNE